MAGRGARMREETLRGLGFPKKEAGAEALALKEKRIPRLVAAQCAHKKPG